MTTPSVSFNPVSIHYRKPYRTIEGYIPMTTPSAAQTNNFPEFISYLEDILNDKSLQTSDAVMEMAEDAIQEYLPNAFDPKDIPTLLNTVQTQSNDQHTIGRPLFKALLTRLNITPETAFNATFNTAFKDYKGLEQNYVTRFTYLQDIAKGFGDKREALHLEAYKNFILADIAESDDSAVTSKNILKSLMENVKRFAENDVEIDAQRITQDTFDNHKMKLFSQLIENFEISPKEAFDQIFSLRETSRFSGTDSLIDNNMMMFLKHAANNLQDPAKPNTEKEPSAKAIRTAAYQEILAHKGQAYANAQTLREYGLALLAPSQYRRALTPVTINTIKMLFKSNENESKEFLNDLTKSMKALSGETPNSKQLDLIINEIDRYVEDKDSVWNNGRKPRAIEILTHLGGTHTGEDRCTDVANMNMSEKMRARVLDKIIDLAVKTPASEYSWEQQYHQNAVPLILEAIKVYLPDLPHDAKDGAKEALQHKRQEVANTVLDLIETRGDAKYKIKHLHAVHDQLLPKGSTQAYDKILDLLAKEDNKLTVSGATDQISKLISAPYKMTNPTNAAFVRKAFDIFMAINMPSMNPDSTGGNDKRNDEKTSVDSLLKKFKRLQNDPAPAGALPLTDIMNDHAAKVVSRKQGPQMAFITAVAGHFIPEEGKGKHRAIIIQSNFTAARIDKTVYTAFTNATVDHPAGMIIHNGDKTQTINQALASIEKTGFDPETGQRNQANLMNVLGEATKAHTQGNSGMIRYQVA